MSCYRRPYRDRKGKERKAKNYTVEFQDHTGTIRRITAVRDKAASEEIERAVLKMVSLRLAGLDPDVELTRFLESCPPEIRESLAVWKIITGARAAAGRSIDQHIDDWIGYVKSGDTTAKHVKEFRSKVEKFRSILIGPLSPTSRPLI